MARMRLDKLLGHAGMGSRKQLRGLIRQGHVMVNGQRVEDESLLVDTADEITVDSVPVRYSPVVALMMHKPEGVLTAARDAWQPTVMDLIDDDLRHRHLAPVGRLDKDTTGLLLITDDGIAAHALISPKHHVPKVYIAQLDVPVDSADQAAFAQGIELSDHHCEPAQLTPLPGLPYRAQVVLHEGKYHQVKRMFGKCGKTVLHLHRQSFGSLTLPEDLAPGQYRQLTLETWNALRQEAGLPPVSH